MKLQLYLQQWFVKRKKWVWLYYANKFIYVNSIWFNHPLLKYNFLGISLEGELGENKYHNVLILIRIESPR